MRSSSGTSSERILRIGSNCPIGGFRGRRKRRKRPPAPGRSRSNASVTIPAMRYEPIQAADQARRRLLPAARSHSVRGPMKPLDEATPRSGDAIPLTAQAESPSPGKGTREHSFDNEPHTAPKAYSRASTGVAVFFGRGQSAGRDQSALPQRTGRHDQDTSTTSSGSGSARGVEPVLATGAGTRVSYAEDGAAFMAIGSIVRGTAAALADIAHLHARGDAPQMSFPPSCRLRRQETSSDAVTRAQER